MSKLQTVERQKAGLIEKEQLKVEEAFAKRMLGQLCEASGVTATTLRDDSRMFFGRGDKDDKDLQTGLDIIACMLRMEGVRVD